MEEFCVSINDGPIQRIQTKTGKYWMVVVTALSILDYVESENGVQKVKIWCDHLLPEYGPYLYECDVNHMNSVVSCRLD